LEPAIYLAVVSRYHSYLNSSKQLLQLYNGEEPFPSFLKKYFSANKKFGSKDRKHIAHLCYSFFRLGRAATNLDIEERILLGLFLCSESSNEILASLKPEWNENVSRTLKEKLLIINYSLLIPEVFPWKDELSKGIDHEKFCGSFFIQPDLFIRVRPGKEKLTREKLRSAAIDFKNISDTCIALPNSSKIDTVIEVDKEAIIQDRNSQETGRFLNLALASLDSDKPSVWDCCAASGGKSILAYDINPNIGLTVSDVRESILSNLRKRFERAGITNYNSFRIDLGAAISGIRHPKSEILIADVPCTGSGTWSRTPEQLYFFDEKKIEEYSALQKKIVSNVIPQLQRGGSFIYITCSVFKKENEDVITFIKEKFHLQLKQMEILKGYDKKADSMFVAVLSLPED